jgi:hypothetical protein
MVFLPSSFFPHNVGLMVWSNFYYIRQKVLVVIVGKGVFGLPIPKGFIVTLDQYNWINLPLAPALVPPKKSIIFWTRLRED